MAACVGDSDGPLGASGVYGGRSEGAGGGNGDGRGREEKIGR